LLDNRADVNASRRDGAKPIDVACRKDYFQIVKLLQ